MARKQKESSKQLFVIPAESMTFEAARKATKEEIVAGVGLYIIAVGRYTIESVRPANLREIKNAQKEALK